jgi:hypothetical protein
MTSTAFQLGTTLTQGWFWARHRGGTAVYRGPSLTQVDFRRILRVAGPESSEIILPPGLSHPPDSTHCYVVRRFNGRGVSERTSTAATRVRIGPDRRLAPFAPNAVLDLKGEQVAGCKLRLTWFYSPLDQETPPQEFHVYWNGGTGPIDLEHPLGIVPYEGRRLYVCETGPLDDGQYTFAVSACDAHHAEAASLAYLVCCIASLPPEVPTILRAEAV